MAMTIICPDKSLKEWKRLVSDIGEAEAYLSFFRASNRIPFTAEAEKLLGMKRDVVPVDTKLAGVEVVAPPSGKRPKQMFVRIVGDDQDMYPVASFAEASKKFSQARDATFKLGPGAEVPKVEVLDQDGKLVGTFSQNGKIWSGGKVIYDPAPTQIAAPAVKPAASAPVSAPKSPLQIINASKAVKLSVPEGTTMIRGTDSKGRKSVQPLGNFKTYNPFQGADIVKIEAGRIGLQKQFIPMDEPVKVGERVKQGDITEAIEPSTASAPITAQSVEQLRAALPTSGLSPEQQSLISAFLDSPLSAALEGVRFKIADALEKGWQGSYFDGLVEIARNSDPATAPHEFAHRVWELLPEEVRQQFEAMRVAEINSRLSKPMNATLIQQLEKLRDNPTSGGEQFIQGGYDRSLYHLSSPEEFFTHSFSDKFTGENLNPEQKTIWGQIRDLFRSIIAAIKKFFKLPQSQDELLTNIMSGRYNVSPEGSAAVRQGAVPPNVFYSRLVRTVEQSQQGKATGAQWKATIRNSKLGANADEMGLVGVGDLEDGKVYTKQEVLDYLSANQVVVKDVTLGDVGHKFGTPEEQVAAKSRLESARERFANANAQNDPDFAEASKAYDEAYQAMRDVVPGYGREKTDTTTHFSTYQLPGGKEGSYREVLLTVPEKPFVMPEDTKVVPAGKGMFEIRQSSTGKLRSPRVFKSEEDALYWIKNESNYVEKLNWRDGHSQYEGIANPIVRLRFNERTTADGKRMLFLEEVQPPQKGQFKKMPALFQKNWREIAFKWAIRHAAENGFDSVGWTTGEQQAARYDLSKQVDAIHLTSRGGDGDARTWLIETRQPGNRGYTGLATGIKTADLESYIGKDLAKQVVENPAELSHDFSGQDLKIGGGGLSKLYDTDFRNVVNNLPAVKKAGQKVGTEKIKVTEENVGIVGQEFPFTVEKPNGEEYESNFRTQEAAQSVADRIGGKVVPTNRDSYASVNTITITPAIRDSVMGGQPLASLPQAALPEDPAEEPKRETHQLGSRQWFTEYPEALTAADYAKGREKLVNFVQNELFLPGFEHEKNIFVFKPDGETHEAEGRKLVDKLVEILQGQSDRKSDAAVMAPLITRMIDYNIDAIQQIFSKEIAGNLISLAGANASDYGQRLAMVKGDIPNDVTEVARNLNFNLRATYSNLAGGGAFDEVTMKRILTLFRTEFSDEELAKISAEHPTMTGFINDLIARMGQEGGNRLYRAVQNRLSPKNLSLKALEKNALFQEEVNAIIETLAKAGIKEPTDRPKLSPLEKLRLMVTDQSQVKINDAIEAAISTGEIEAGKQAARNATRGDKTALDELEQRYAAGELPSDDEIAEGLKLANFSKWQRLRDDWAKYDPVTVKLARQVAADDFKGLKFGTPKAKPADTRISINDLAKQPDAEIARVLDAYLQNIEANITMDNSSPETRQEVRRVIQEQLLSQINDVIRPKVRDAMFAEKKPGKSATPPDKRLAELANSKLFSDNRIDQAAELEKLSRKSAIQRLVPTVSGIAKEILSTPQIFQGDMPKNFVNEFIKKFTADFSVDESQVPGLRKAVTEAYAGKLKEAAKKAWESALKRMTPAEQAGMTPAEQAVMPKSDKRFWKILTQLANAGVLDSDEALRKIAAAKGHPMPTPEEVAGIKRSVERIEELENPTPAKRAKILNDPGLTPKEKSRQMRTEQRLASAANSGEIGQLQRKLGAQWSRLTKPFGLNPLTAEGRNTSQAIYQFSIANWLAKFRFPFTLAQHVWWQFVWSLLTRPPAVIWQMVEESKKADKPVEAWDTVHNVLQSTIKQWLDSLAPGIRAARGQMAGRGVNRNLEGLLLGVNALERAAEASKAYYTKGDKARAAATGFISLWRFALRVVGALDAFQGEQVEFQEIRNQYNIEMAKQGKTRAEIEMTWQQAWGDMKRKMAEALVEAREMAEAYHTDTSPNALKESADSLLKEHQWQWMELLGMQADSLRAQALRRRMGMAWQSPPASGSLGNVAYKGAQAWNKFVLSKNLPMFSAYFARAISNGMNYFGRFTPFYKAFTGRVNQKGEGSDFSNETEADRKENFIRGVIVGPLLGGLLAYLIYNRLAKVNSHYPTDKKEREKFINEGHKVNTIEFLNDDGSFIPFGLNIGPFSPVASYAVAAQAVMDQNDKYAKEQAKADAFAAAHGLPSKPIEHDWVIDDMEVAGKAAYQTILGSATAVGLTSGFNEFGIPNAKKAIASVLSPLVPGLPNYQSISRMMGVSLDSHMATVFDFMVPLPTSSARMVNALGDPVRTPNDIQRVVQELTGGSYPFPVDPKSVAQGHAAYQALFSTGYMPPPVSRARGYVINGEYRPMNDSELQQYTVARGQNFKANLAALGPNPTVEQVKGAYQQANASALAGVGAAAPTRPTASRRAGTSGSSRGSVARNAGVRSSAGRGLIRGSLKMRSGRRAGLRGLSGVRRSSSSMALSARRKSSGSSLRMKKRRARLV